MDEKVIPFTKRLNHWGSIREPFFLLVDYELEQIQAWPLRDIRPDTFQFQFNTPLKKTDQTLCPVPLEWTVDYPSLDDYKRAYQIVQQRLHHGDSFLLNLTFPSKVSTNWSLRDIYQRTQANYKLWWKDKFVVFSPETFVQIRDGKIFSYPMKGTLAGHLPGQLLLDDPKEKAEHATIVDLIRNDLSQVAQHVHVNKYRYLEHISAADGGLWQTSSEISGDLPPNFHKNLGDLIFRLLPAGSISGAPKAKTVEIIQQAEQQKRGYYTGIAAHWDGYQLDSCVLIRFLEKSPTGLRYWSGGGITAYSNQAEEYQELKEKVYLPIHNPMYTTTAR